MPHPIDNKTVSTPSTSTPIQASAPSLEESKRPIEYNLNDPHVLDAILDKRNLLERWVQRHQPHSLAIALKYAHGAPTEDSKRLFVIRVIEAGADLQAYSNGQNALEQALFTHKDGLLVALICHYAPGLITPSIIARAMAQISSDVFENLPLSEYKKYLHQSYQRETLLYHCAQQDIRKLNHILKNLTPTEQYTYNRILFNDLVHNPKLLYTWQQQNTTACVSEVIQDYYEKVGNADFLRNIQSSLSLKTQRHLLTMAIYKRDTGFISTLIEGNPEIYNHYIFLYALNTNAPLETLRALPVEKTLEYLTALEKSSSLSKKNYDNPYLQEYLSRLEPGFYYNRPELYRFILKRAAFRKAWCHYQPEAAFIGLKHFMQGHQNQLHQLFAEHINFKCYKDDYTPLEFAVYHYKSPELIKVLLTHDCTLLTKQLFLEIVVDTKIPLEFFQAIPLHIVSDFLNKTHRHNETYLKLLLQYGPDKLTWFLGTQTKKQQLLWEQRLHKQLDMTNHRLIQNWIQLYPHNTFVLKKAPIKLLEKITRTMTIDLHLKHNGKTLLSHAIADKDINRIEILLQANKSVLTFNDFKALIMMGAPIPLLAQIGHRQTMEFLLTHNHHGNTFLEYALANYDNATDYLLSLHPRIYSDKFIHQISKRPRFLLRLITNYPDIIHHLMNREKLTSTVISCIKKLVNLNADLTYSLAGKTIIDKAITAGHHKLLSLFTEKNPSLVDERIFINILKSGNQDLYHALPTARRAYFVRQHHFYNQHNAIGYALENQPTLIPALLRDNALVTVQNMLNAVALKKINLACLDKLITRFYEVANHTQTGNRFLAYAKDYRGSPFFEVLLTRVSQSDLQNKYLTKMVLKILSQEPCVHDQTVKQVIENKQYHLLRIFLKHAELDKRILLYPMNQYQNLGQYIASEQHMPLDIFPMIHKHAADYDMLLPQKWLSSLAKVSSPRDLKAKIATCTDRHIFAQLQEIDRQTGRTALFDLIENGHNDLFVKYLPYVDINHETLNHQTVLTTGIQHKAHIDLEKILHSYTLTERHKGLVVYALAQQQGGASLSRLVPILGRFEYYLDPQDKHAIEYTIQYNNLSGLQSLLPYVPAHLRHSLLNKALVQIASGAIVRHLFEQGLPAQEILLKKYIAQTKCISDLLKLCSDYYPYFKKHLSQLLEPKTRIVERLYAENPSLLPTLLKSETLTHMPQQALNTLRKQAAILLLKRDHKIFTAALAAWKTIPLRGYPNGQNFAHLIAQTQHPAGLRLLRQYPGIFSLLTTLDTQGLAPCDLAAENTDLQGFIKALSLSPSDISKILTPTVFNKALVSGHEKNITYLLNQKLMLETQHVFQILKSTKISKQAKLSYLTHQAHYTPSALQALSKNQGIRKKLLEALLWPDFDPDLFDLMVGQFSLKPLLTNYRSVNGKTLLHCLAESHSQSDTLLHLHKKQLISTKLYKSCNDRDIHPIVSALYNQRDLKFAFILLKIGEQLFSKEQLEKILSHSGQHTLPYYALQSNRIEFFKKLIPYKNLFDDELVEICEKDEYHPYMELLCQHGLISLERFQKRLSRLCQENNSEDLLKILAKTPLELPAINDGRSWLQTLEAYIWEDAYSLYQRVRAFEQQVTVSLQKQDTASLHVSAQKLPTQIVMHVITKVCQKHKNLDLAKNLKSICLQKSGQSSWSSLMGSYLGLPLFAYASQAIFTGKDFLVTKKAAIAPLCTLCGITAYRYLNSDSTHQPQSEDPATLKKSGKESPVV